jgi:hypothetical protein
MTYHALFSMTCYALACIALPRLTNSALLCPALFRHAPS